MEEDIPYGNITGCKSDKHGQVDYFQIEIRWSGRGGVQCRILVFGAQVPELIFMPLSIGENSEICLGRGVQFCIEIVGVKYSLPFFSKFDPRPPEEA